MSLKPPSRDPHGLAEQKLGLLRFQQAAGEGISEAFEAMARAMGLDPVAARAGVDARGDKYRPLLERWTEESLARMAPIVEGPEPPEERIDAWLGALLEIQRARARSDPDLYRDFALWATDMQPLMRAQLGRIIATLEGLTQEAGLPEGAGWAVLESTFPWTAPMQVLAWLDADSPAPEMRAAAMRRLAQLRAEGRAGG